MLTDAGCRNAKPREKAYKLTDSHGLYLEVKTTGVRAWRYRYRIEGKENLFAIGNYPGVSLQEARKLRDDARAMVKKGIHPAHQRRLETLVRASELGDTFEGVAQEWILRNEGDWSPNYIRQIRARMSQDVFPWVGKLPVKDVKPAHVLDVLKRIERRSPTQAKLVQTWVGGVFRFAVAHLKREDDPTWPLRRAVKTTQVRHHAKIKDKEIGAFLRAIDAAVGDVATKAATRLMWMTATRANEVTGARWAEIDLDEGVWSIPAARMKMRSEHSIPLSTQAVELLKSMLPFSGTLEHVFPHRSDRKRHMSSESLRDLFRRAGYEGKFTPHGIRGTFSTIANEARWDSEAIELCLAHQERNAIRAAYNDAKLMDERRELLQWWSDLSEANKVGAQVLPQSPPIGCRKRPSLSRSKPERVRGLPALKLRVQTVAKRPRSAERKLCA